MLQRQWIQAERLYGFIQMRAEEIYYFLLGYIYFLNGLQAYYFYLKKETPEMNHFWYAINEVWLKDHYTIEELFYDD